MTNKEWLDYLAQNAPDELAAWFDAERVTNQAEMLHMPESHESATMQHIRQVIEDTVKRGVYGDTEPENDDSRERLEADISKYLNYPSDCRAVYDYNAVIGWLDRQAAITEREYGERMASEAMCSRVCVVVGKQREQIAELTAERDNLKAELIDERGELNRQINTMRDVIRDYRNERDHYRSKFGKCIDYADAIHALMDDEGVA